MGVGLVQNPSCSSGVYLSTPYGLVGSGSAGRHMPHLAFTSYMADARGHVYLVPRTWQCQQKHTAGIH